MIRSTSLLSFIVRFNKSHEFKKQIQETFREHLGTFEFVCIHKHKKLTWSSSALKRLKIANETNKQKKSQQLVYNFP